MVDEEEMKGDKKLRRPAIFLLWRTFYLLQTMRRRRCSSC
jgi:hypothetical protein